MLVTEAQKLAESLLKLSWIVVLMWQTINNLTLAVKEPLTEIVWYILNLEADCTSLMKLWSLMPVNEGGSLAAEELKNFVRLLSIHLDFMKHRELNSPLVLAIGLNFSLLPRFKFFSKLITGEHEYFKALVLVLIV